MTSLFRGCTNPSGDEQVPHATPSLNGSSRRQMIEPTSQELSSPSLFHLKGTQSSGSSALQVRSRRQVAAATAKPGHGRVPGGALPRWADRGTSSRYGSL